MTVIVELPDVAANGLVVKLIGIVGDHVPAPQPRPGIAADAPIGYSYCNVTTPPPVAVDVALPFAVI